MQHKENADVHRAERGRQNIETQSYFANVLSMWVKFRDQRLQPAGHTRAKTATHFWESLDSVLGNVKSSPHLRTNFPSSLISESPRGARPHSVAEDREHPLGEEETREFQKLLGRKRHKWSRNSALHVQVKNVTTPLSVCNKLPSCWSLTTLLKAQITAAFQLK